MQNEPDRLNELLSSLLDGTLSEADAAALTERLLADPAARQLYHDHVGLHAMLHWREAQLSRSERVAIVRAGKQPSCAGEVAPAVAKPSGRRLVGTWITAVAAALLLSLLAALAVRYGNRVASTAVAKGTVVGRVVRLAHCSWEHDAEMLQVGDKIVVGQTLSLSGGALQAEFDVGVKLILQGPARFVIESPKAGRLLLGKLAAEVTKVKGRCFAVNTDDAAYIDQGTEFGVEVTRDGSSRMHVYQGAVDVSPKGIAGLPSQSHRLLANGEARLESSSQTMTLIDDEDHSFLRSLDDADRDRHVVAYWRFEDRPVGMVVPNTANNKRASRATLDASFNGNDLFCYAANTNPIFSSEVPAGMIPRTGDANRGCLNNSEPPPRNSRNFYTHSAFSHAAPFDIQSITPASWTIEVSIKPALLDGSVQTFIGRDGSASGSGEQIPARLAFQIDEDNHFALQFVDADGREHGVVAGDLPLEVGRWYHLAATSEGRRLLLYIDIGNGQGYQLQATTELPATGSTALGKGCDAAEWSLGRGQKKGHVADNFRGWIDEVRISDIARDPGEFLFCK